MITDDWRFGWRVDAACRDTDLAVFYPEKGGSTYWARRLCGACPTREPCLQEALDRRDPWGWWGGMSPEQREKLLSPAEPATACAEGHDWTDPANIRTDRRGNRRCVPCHRSSKRRNKAAA